MHGNVHAIQTFGLVKHYGGRKAVEGIDLAIEEGEVFSLLGPNGAGKTTTIKMLCCLLEPTAGTASVMGRDIRREPLAVKQVINVSPQETAVAGRLSAWENLLLMGGIYGLGKAETKRRAAEFIALMGLLGREKEPARKLSGGLQRRLSIAMALISDPRVLFLDEPTLGLDPKARRELWREIEKLKGKKTILLTTHYLEEADALADRIAIIDAGRIVALGTPEELKRGLHGLETMRIKAMNLSLAAIASLRRRCAEVREIENGIEIKAEKLDFDAIVDLLRAEGAKIREVSRQEPSLDDVFLKLTGKEADK